MELNKKEMINELTASVKELQQGIDIHCGLVAAILEEKVDERDLQDLVERCPRRSREQSLKDAITEAIDVLEESRKAFKSKKLEALRKKLTRVLIAAE